MTTKIFQVVLCTTMAFVMVLLSTGCVTLSTHHTGRTNGEGTTTIFASYNLGLMQEEQFVVSNSENERVNIVEFGLVQGWKERFDIGFKMNNTGHMQYLSKYQFAGSQVSKMASSVGAEVGFSPGSLLFGIASYNASIHSFNSFHPSSNVAITFNPRYAYLRVADFWTDINLINRRDHLFGYSAGVVLGERHRVSFEVSQFVSGGNLLSQQPLFSVAYIVKLQK